jgi:hypothetical protein
MPEEKRRRKPDRAGADDNDCRLSHSKPATGRRIQAPNFVLQMIPMKQADATDDSGGMFVSAV